MSQILFTTNPDEYSKLEGVYVTETNPPGFVVGADLSTVMIGGACVRGPVDTPVEITSAARFREIFGARDYTSNGTGGAIVGEVWKALLNKPFAKVVVVRAAASAAVKASFTLESLANGTGTALLRVDASSVGAWGNSVKIKVETATDADVNHFNLRVSYLGEVKLYQNLDISSSNDNTLTVLGDDYGNWITLTKLAAGVPITTGMSGLDADGYVLLGQTVASFTSVAGADGTIADSDYTGTGRVIDLLASYKGPSAVLIAERANSTINAALKTKAAAASDRMFLVWNGTYGASTSTVITDAANYRSDRVVYCYNAPYTIDPLTAQKIQTPPHHWMAAIFSQSSADQHVGSNRTKKWISGITTLTSMALTRDDYKSLRAAGIAALERDVDGSFVFVSGVTTSLTSGLTEIARRRQADFLLLSMSASIVDLVKEPGPEVLAEAASRFTHFLDDLRTTPRIVKDFAIDIVSGNTDTQQAQGIEVIQVDVDLIEHALAIVIKSNIGTNVTISEDRV